MKMLKLKMAKKLVLDTNTDILMRKVDETTTDICQVKRQSARLSLHNTLEIVPENKPIETKHTEPNENNEKDEITEIIEKLENAMTWSP